MPEKPIDEWTLADALNGLETLKRRAARAPRGAIVRGATTEEDALNLVAKEVIDGLDDGSAEQRFLKYARVWRTGSYGAAEHTAALMELASAFGGDAVDNKKFLRWMVYKGVIIRTYTRSRDEGKN